MDATTPRRAPLASRLSLEQAVIDAVLAFPTGIIPLHHPSVEPGRDVRNPTPFERSDGSGAGVRRLREAKPKLLEVELGSWGARSTKRDGTEVFTYDEIRALDENKVMMLPRDAHSRMEVGLLKGTSRLVHAHAVQGILVFVATRFSEDTDESDDGVYHTQHGLWVAPVGELTDIHSARGLVLDALVLDVALIDFYPKWEVMSRYMPPRVTAPTARIGGLAYNAACAIRVIALLWPIKDHRPEDRESYEMMVAYARDVTAALVSIWRP